jgi:hypothetical protein
MPRSAVRAYPDIDWWSSSLHAGVYDSEAAGIEQRLENRFRVFLFYP